jgi:hypothetical protein
MNGFPLPISFIRNHDTNTNTTLSSLVALCTCALNTNHTLFTCCSLYLCSQHKPHSLHVLLSVPVLSTQTTLSSRVALCTCALNPTLTITTIPPTPTPITTHPFACQGSCRLPRQVSAARDCSDSSCRPPKHCQDVSSFLSHVLPSLPHHHHTSHRQHPIT